MLCRADRRRRSLGWRSPSIQLGQPTLTGPVGVHRILAARRGIRRAKLDVTVVLNNCAMTGQLGQALDLALTIANCTGAPIYAQPTMGMYEVASTALAPFGVVKSTSGRLRHEAMPEMRAGPSTAPCRRSRQTTPSGRGTTALVVSVGEKASEEVRCGPRR